MATIGYSLKNLCEELEVAIVNGVRSGWTLANNKNNALCDRVFGDNKGKLTKAQERRYYSNSDKALEAFLQRKTSGLNLSERVWNYAGQFKEKIELALDLGIRNGLSAAEMARELKQYLREPDKLFRRVRDQHGQLRLSQAAKAYHPGQGVCRSSYKNALRLAATETNIAYRTADYLSWQQLDFVVGIEVRLSGNHPLPDICDDLKGKYPKDFKFTGWHPCCRCYAIPILKPDDSSTEPDDANTVHEPPEGFQNWITENSDRIERATNLPYFLRDNSQYIKNLKLTRSAESGITEAVRQDFTVREIKPVSVPSAGFHTYKEFGNGGRIEIMDGYEQKSDYGDLITLAREFATEGKTVQLPNPVHYKDEKYKQIYGKLTGTPYERKCPDLIIDGNFYEYESYLPPFKKRKLANMISHGSEQSSKIIINNNKGASDQFILRNIHNRLRNKTFKYNIDEVWRLTCKTLC